MKRIVPCKRSLPYILGSIEKRSLGFSSIKLMDCYHFKMAFGLPCRVLQNKNNSLERKVVERAYKTKARKRLKTIEVEGKTR
ncbi:hypothetical protein Gasu2_20700 [Galdieria sulphuraria]|nr:hypothetical protein Gasu2_20700 [Galdieria sulphuraria]